MRVKWFPQFRHLVPVWARDGGNGYHVAMPNIPSTYDAVIPAIELIREMRVPELELLLLVVKGELATRYLAEASDCSKA